MNTAHKPGAGGARRRTDRPQRPAGCGPRGNTGPRATADAGRDLQNLPRSGPSRGRETGPRIPDGPLFGVEVCYVLHDCLLYVLRFRALAPQVHPVGQSIAVRAERYEVLDGIWAALAVRYHVMYAG